MADSSSDALSLSPLLARMAKLSRDELEALQLKKLRHQLSRLWHGSPYYRSRMETAKIVPDELSSLRAFCEKFPTSNKADFLEDQAQARPFGHRLGIPREQVALVNMTGGTSGQGQEIYGRSQRDVHMQGYLHALPWFLAGLRPGQIAINCVPAGGMTTGGWGPGEGLRIIGATAFHVGGNLSTEAAIDLMLQVRDVNFIYASTNYLHTLTQSLQRRGIMPKEAFPNMKGIFIAAEGYPVNWAQQIQDHWGTTLHEGYGSTQCAGFAGSTCEQGVLNKDGQRALIRLFEWETFFEVVNPDTMEPARSGETGELVVTNLAIEGSPVIRFRSGDAVRFVSHRDAGGALTWNAVESGTIGRYDDMIKIRGNNMWPSAVDSVVFAHTDVAEYAGRVHTSAEGKTEVEVRVGFTDHGLHLGTDYRRRIIDAIRDDIKERTNVGMTVKEVPRAELPEFKYKARRWTDERQQGYRL